MSETTGFDPPSFDEMPCPWGRCFAIMSPRVHRTDPRDSSMIEVVYPIHEVVGSEVHWFGRCPASQLVVLPTLTERGRQVLADAEREYVRRYAERVLADAERHDRIAEIVHDIIDHPEKYPSTPPRKTPPDVEDYFPGRPADAPEPGVGDQPAAVLPPTQIGQKLGKAEAVSTLEQHLAMLAATRRKIGEAQEAVAIAIAGLETLEAATAQLGPHCDAAAALADATVGILSGPSEAVLMRATLAAAKSTTTGEDGIVQATGLVRARLMAIADSLASASRHAETYAAQQHG